MDKMDSENFVTTEEELERLYGPPKERALLKQMDRLDEHARSFIRASPFLLLATCGPSGADCSPRGDAPGFVEVADDETLLVPDRRGNNRIDSLRNIVKNPDVGLLFLVPGADETFRVNGKARLSVDPGLLRRFDVRGRAPKTVLVVRVEEAFMQCSRALIRSDLWNPDRFAGSRTLPSAGVMLAAHTGGRVDAAEYDARAAEEVPKTLY